MEQNDVGCSNEISLHVLTCHGDAMVSNRPGSSLKTGATGWYVNRMPASIMSLGWTPMPL